jgi:hypothetical protein
MAGHSPSKTGVNALMSRPSTPFFSLPPRHQDVDARHKAGHDNLWYCRFAKDMSRVRG